MEPNFLNMSCGLSDIPCSESEICSSKSKQYWEEVPPTIDGMLGGFGHISQIDIQGSRQLLKQLFHSKTPPGKSHVLDCGAGIGRVSKYLLTEIFDRVDLLEQNPEFLEKAKIYLGHRMRKIEQFWSCTLQCFVPEIGKYDVIWVQWVLPYLTDEEVVQFLHMCKRGLKPNGVIVVKENIASTELPEMDEKDSSVTRTFGQFRDIFEKTGLDCFKQLKQHHFPKGLFPVIMFALKNVEPSNDRNDSLKEFCIKTCDNTEREVESNTI